MGQKTHPLGFRLGIVQEHKSVWYANFNQYANILEEDDKIRTYINTISRANYISNVKICRNVLKDHIQLTIETGKPGILVDDMGNGLKNLLKNLKKLLPVGRQLTIKVSEIEFEDLDAKLLADLVAKQLEKRVAFRRATRTVLQRAQRQNVNGIKIQVSGRLNGAEIARSEWVREGRVPLQTLRADIDYATTEANTIYGVLGIKIWLFKSEILSK
jgi:small subunit ribosomal protein S3|uniref:Small ribosomal subunit protein uS3c n=1 Tax=Pseudo-nitzschia multiseries TaxID=37319 RepID=A0A0K1DC10_PSEMU|nr:ribosomal protein S3 [Pseudo-nitzschia multiseries]AKT26087.1 ribosomal protein S3 [Pseudo-nitzschia multiseries]UBA15558.1 ribosomal protein S3 [Pseudo-nitzschia multiseries]